MAKAKLQLPFAFDKALAIDWLTNTGGYDILAPEFFEHILPSHVVKRLTFDHAGGEGKYATFKDGRELRSCIGVSEFGAIDALAATLGIEPCRSYFGRGRNFEETKHRVLAALRK